jgi:hypothetical protein
MAQIEGAVSEFRLEQLDLRLGQLLRWIVHLEFYQPLRRWHCITHRNRSFGSVAQQYLVAPNPATPASRSST